MRRRPQRVRLESSGASMSPPPALSRSGVRLIALVLVVISLWLLVNFIGQVVVAAQMDRQIADKQAEMTQIEAGNAALKDHVAYAESPAYAEQIAREQLGYAREGDTVILPTLPDRLTAPAAAPPPLPPPAHEPNWRGWLHAFFPPNTTP